MNDIISKNVSQIVLNRPQRNFIINLGLARSTNSIWGRGVGKSTILGFIMHSINKVMPRSCWVLQGATFQQILTRTLPGTIAFLRQMGYRQNVDFFLNTFPPRKYALPYQSPLKPDHCLFLVDHKNLTSVAFTFFSQDRSSSRGPSRDGILCDESLLIDIDKFNEEAKATNRGNDLYFSKIKWHHGIFHFSSMPTGNHWLINSSKYYDELNLERYWKLRESQVKLELDFVKTKNEQLRRELLLEIAQLSNQVKFFAHKGFYYSEYSAFENIMNLNPRYFDDLYQDNTELLFRIEVLNERMFKVEDSFYPAFDRSIHCYKGHWNYSYLDNIDIVNVENNNHLNSLQDLDCNPDLALHLGLDFGTAINWIVVGQEITTAKGKQFNFIKNFFVKSPKTIDDVTIDYCEYYRHHKKKVIHLYPDGEGNVKRANISGQLSYVDQIEKIMRSYGWNVIREKNIKYNTPHNEVYILWDRMLSARDNGYPSIQFNLINCKELIYSIEQTPSIDSTAGKIKKNKSSEKKLRSNREQATDGGDAADQIIRNKYGLLLKSSKASDLSII